MSRSPRQAKIHIAKKELSLDDATYRALLQRVTGRTSSAGLSDVQLDAVLAELKRLGFKPRSRAAKITPSTPVKRPLAAGAEARKIRALWISLYHLGVISDSAETALAAFVKRQLKIDALQWVRQDAYKITEALKSWAARAAGVDWSAYYLGRGNRVEKVLFPRARVIEAQWRILAALGVIRIADSDARDLYVARIVGVGRRISTHHLTDAQADHVIAVLGQQIRDAKGAAA